MANLEESNPLLPNQEQDAGAKIEQKSTTVPADKHSGSPPPAAVSIGWTADGLPVGEPITERAQWDSDLFSCLGRNDEFCSSDLEVCLLGSVAPCMLYGTNVERLGSRPGTFANHCLPYMGFYLIGKTFFGWNCLAPWFSYPTRTAIRRKFNLEGAVRRLRNHVRVWEALWRTRFNLSNAKRHAILVHMFFVMLALFVKKAVRFVAGFHIPGLTPDRSWS
ncbi:hypothetical protein CASFOL_013369 [Castilleja foliolosa]|uniref:Uncharacterized protein n=1 Tax=Castilleja foliolosa TaxID=1961234 RepID=A0ABD3DL19_9LAMI